jgi:hypothetical protein
LLAFIPERSAVGGNREAYGKQPARAPRGKTTEAGKAERFPTIAHRPGGTDSQLASSDYLGITFSEIDSLNTEVLQNDAQDLIFLRI